MVSLLLLTPLGSCGDDGTTGPQACMLESDCGAGEICEFADDYALSGTCVAAEPGPDGPSPSPFYLIGELKLDVLFVLDNSRDMGPVQARLAAALDDFMRQLETYEGVLDLRFAFTTTSLANPRCVGVPATGGSFQLQSCRARLDDFVAQWGQDQVTDVSDEACLSLCDLEDAELQIEPTSSVWDAEVRPRPWLEVRHDWSNLVSETDPARALACFLPMGITGCGFEAPIGAGQLALGNALGQVSPDAPELGFVRPYSRLVVIMATTEPDCSIRATHHEHFVGDMTFWPEGVMTATGAVCWNAGVECQGDGAPYTSCDAVDKADDGSETYEPLDAVMVPVTELVGQLQTVANSVYSEGGLGTAVELHAFTGVPPGYPDEAIVYADDPDPGQQLEYGVGPGCDGAGVTARPPARLRALTEATVQVSYEPEPLGELYSVCTDDYSSQMSGLATRLINRAPPPCVPLCARDVEPDTPGLQFECTVKIGGAAGEVELPSCADGIVPDGAAACYKARAPEQLPQRCLEAGYNLSLDIVWSADAELTWRDAVVGASCQRSFASWEECPTG